MRTPILQFGTSRFLQAHADLFLSEAAAAGQSVGPVTVVQTSGSSERASRVAAFNDPAGFLVNVKGLTSGRLIDQTIRVTSVVRGLSTSSDWPEVVRIAVEETDIIISNTADAGYVVAYDARMDLTRDGVAPPSFPEKLLAALAARHRAGGRGLTLFPCELIERNGDQLKMLVLEIARRSGATAGLLDWIEGQCIWANSLVDRIVSTPIEPIGAIAEPYGLWAIERQPGLAPPCQHPAIRMVDDLTPIAALKLFLLNLGHTVLADRWNDLGQPADLTVRTILGNPEIKRDLVDLYARELVPGFAAHGMAEEAQEYVRVALERFENPFLDHRLSDIFTNHRQKIERRIVAFLRWSGRAGVRQPRLRALAAQAGFRAEVS